MQIRSGCKVILRVALAAMLGATLLAAPALAQQDTLSLAEAQTALGSVLPNVKVLAVSPSLMQGLWEIVLQDTSGQKGVLYLNKKQQILFSGSLISLTTKTNLTKIKIDSLNVLDFAAIPLDDALVMGSPDAPLRVIVFDDPD